MFFGFLLLLWYVSQSFFWSNSSFLLAFARFEKNMKNTHSHYPTTPFRESQSLSRSQSLPPPPARRGCRSNRPSGLWELPPGEVEQLKTTKASAISLVQGTQATMRWSLGLEFFSRIRKNLLGLIKDFVLLSAQSLFSTCLGY